MIIPVWFAAELAATSAPGNYYGAYYIAFVPIWACLAALVAELLLPRHAWLRGAAIPRLLTCAGLLTFAVVTLDASHRADPMKYWYVYATNVRPPPAIIQRLRDDADRFGWRRYVPLLTNSPEVLLDMPLPPGTRFLAQYPYQFPSADSPRAQELLADLARADVVVEDRQRLRLNAVLERRVRATLQDSFLPLFDWSNFHFYARRDAIPRDAANPSDSPGIDARALLAPP